MTQLRKVADGLRSRFPQAAALLQDAAEDVLAYRHRRSHTSGNSTAPFGAHCLVVALGIAADGQKHALGPWDGSTENARVCQDPLANLQSRGLRTDRRLLVILDGSPALRKAVRATFGEAALVQRCQVHKTRTSLST